MLYLLKYFLTALAHKPPLLVDVREQNDSEPAPQTNVSSTEETPASRKSAREREKTPPPRKKPMGPASKRMKVDTESPPPLSILPHQPQTTQAAPQPATEINIKQNPVEQQFMHFKLEPEETAVSLANEEDVSYDDSAMDDMGIDNSSDYLMESTTEIDAKAGTSTAMDNVDATGDNQESPSETVHFVQGERGKCNLIVRNHLFIRNAVTGNRVHWKCSFYNLRKCKVCCITTNDKIISKHLNHIHPPNLDKLAAKRLLYRKVLTSFIAGDSDY